MSRTTWVDNHHTRSPHGLRHTWASRLAMASVDRRTLMDPAGWTDGRVADEIYSRTTDQHRAEVMAGAGIRLGRG